MYILKIAYDGRYSFQKQPHKNTVCDVLMDTLEECNYLNDGRIIYYGGRTDKGVSALGNFVVVDLKKEPILSHIYSKLKGKGVWVLGYQEIDEIPAVNYRHYRYILPNEDHDIELMKKASKKLIGTHSFHNLSRKDKSKERDPIRTIYDIKLSENEYFITIDIVGKSFLWNMVRRMVSVLSKVGKKEIENWEEYLDKILSKEHREGVSPAPAEGLILVDANVSLNYIYDNYVLKRFKEEWKETWRKSVMTMGICKTIDATI
jgi:tRNA pseudouridine38-40 synthase